MYSGPCQISVMEAFPKTNGFSFRQIVRACLTISLGWRLNRHKKATNNINWINLFYITLPALISRSDSHSFL